MATFGIRRLGRISVITTGFECASHVTRHKESLRPVVKHVYVLLLIFTITGCLHSLNTQPPPPRVALYYLNTRLAIINVIKFHDQRTIL